MKKHFMIFFVLMIVVISGLTPQVQSVLKTSEKSNVEVGLNEAYKWTGKLVGKMIDKHGDGIRIINLEVKLTSTESSSQNHGETSFIGEAIVKIDKPIYEFTVTHCGNPIIAILKINPNEVVCPIEVKIDKIEKKMEIWFGGGKQVNRETVSLWKGIALDAPEKHKLSAFDLITFGQSISDEGSILFYNEKSTWSTYGVHSTYSCNLEIMGDKIIFSYEAKSGKIPHKIICDYGYQYDSLSFNEELTGELYRIKTKKDTLGKTIHINEPIKTDKFTQREIIVPKVGEVIINTNTECKFKEDKFLEQILGEIYYKIKPGINYKVRIPKTSACAVRGTQFITKVEKDGITTLTVIDGEVEFSDIQKRKMILVRKNQKSVVNPGSLPSEPVAIEPNQIPRWWQ